MFFFSCNGVATDTVIYLVLRFHFKVSTVNGAISTILLLDRAISAINT